MINETASSRDNMQVQLLRQSSCQSAVQTHKYQILSNSFMHQETSADIYSIASLHVQLSWEFSALLEGDN